MIFTQDDKMDGFCVSSTAVDVDYVGVNVLNHIAADVMLVVDLGVATRERRERKGNRAGFMVVIPTHDFQEEGEKFDFGSDLCWSCACR